MKRRWLCAGWALLSVLMAGCGGGGSDDAPGNIGMRYEDGSYSVIPGPTTRVKARIVPDNAKPFTGRVTLRAILYDFPPYEDDSAVIASRTLRDVELSGGASVVFDVPGQLNPQGQFYVCVEVDVNGDGLVGQGDRISEYQNSVSAKNLGGTGEELVVITTELEPCGTPESGGYCSSGPGRPVDF